MRGSTPCCSPTNQGVGGNTACVIVEDEGIDPLILDLGTGLRYWGLEQTQEAFRATALVSHLHWDHIQGLPFFTPMHRAGSAMEIVGPVGDGDLCGTISSFLCPPYFPVSIDALAGEFSFRGVRDDEFTHGAATVRVLPVPHVGDTVGYRITVGDASVAYVPDHQQPGSDATHVDSSVLELCDGVDLLIHDAQYTDDEFEVKSDWGHCTVAYAVNVADAAGAKELALFHHDPAHDDAMVDRLEAEAASRRTTGTVVAAREGMKVEI